MELVFWLADPPDQPLFLASLGGSTVFLFGLTRRPAAQPRSLVGGHLGGAVIGILCWRWFGDGVLSCGVAVGATLLFMLLTRTVHPPAGATPLIMVHSHAGLAALIHPLGLALLILALATALWSRLLPGMARYPLSWTEGSPDPGWWGAWIDDPPDRL